MEDRDIGGAPAQLNDGAAQLDLVWGEHGQRGCQRLEHELRHLVSRPLHTLSEVQQHAGEHRNQIDFGFQPRSRHANRFADPPLLVDQIILRDRVEQLMIAAEADAARHIVDPGDIAGPDLIAGD